jgi:hypothetical protein
MATWRLTIDEDSKQSRLEREHDDETVDNLYIKGGADHPLVEALRSALDPLMSWGYVAGPTGPGVLTTLQWKDKGYLHVQTKKLSPKGGQAHDEEDCNEECECVLHMSSDDCTLYETLDNGCSDCPYER